MTDIYLTGAAAEYLLEHLQDKTLAYWTQRLVNMRRKDRPQTFDLPFETFGGAAAYQVAELDKFIEFEKVRRMKGSGARGRSAEVLRAFGIGEPGGSTHGRILKRATVTLYQTPDAKKDIAVQVMLGDPMAVWSMSAEQAVALGKELVEEGQRAQRLKQAEGKA